MNREGIIIIPTVKSDNANDSRSQFVGFRNNRSRFRIIKMTSPLHTKVITPLTALMTQKYVGTGPQKNSSFLASMLLLSIFPVILPLNVSSVALEMASSCQTRKSNSYSCTLSKNTSWKVRA